MTIRLYLNHPLSAGQPITLDRAQAHYLFNVMRLDIGGEIAVFNGHNGEWTANITAAGKRGGEIQCLAQTRSQLDPPDLWLLFAPIKKARTDFIVEKATELGAARICPVTTDFTNSERVRVDRLNAHAVEAAEQCGGTFVPDVAAPQKLSQVLQNWDPARRILFCDETQTDAQTAFAKLPKGPWAILIGPEGGFSDAERQRLLALDFVYRASLGPRILRADTAAVAALTLWQAAQGDWSNGPHLTGV